MKNFDELKATEDLLERIDKKADDLFAKLRQIVTAVEATKEAVDGLPDPEELQSIVKFAEALRASFNGIAEIGGNLPDVNYISDTGIEVLLLRDRVLEVEQAAEGLPSSQYLEEVGEKAQQLLNTLVEINQAEGNQ